MTTTSTAGTLAMSRNRQSAADRFRQRVVESANSRAMADATSRLGAGFNSARRLPPNARAVEVERLERVLEANWRLGRLSVLDHIDFEQLMHDSYRGQWSDMSRALLADSEQYRGAKVQESLMDVMTTDQFANLLTTTIRFGMIERTELAPMELLSMVNRNLRLSTGTTKIPKMRTTGDVVDDCVAELEETKFYAIPTPNLITMPEACKKKFAMGYTREMLGIDPNGLLRAEIDRHGESMDLHIEKLLVDVMFGLYDTSTPGGNPFPYIEDDIMWHTYQLVGAGGPWQNDITSNELDGTFAPFEALERLIEKQRDPYTGEAVAIDQQPKILTTNRTAIQLALDGLGVVQIGRDISGTGNPRIAIERPAGRFDVGAGDISMSRHIWDRLVAWYKTTAGGGLLQAAAETAASDTWLYGDFRRAFAFGTEWDRERLVRQGPNTYEYFAQEVIFAVKWLEKSTPAVTDPMLTYRNRP